MAKKSFRHGTVDGYKQCKPPCQRCLEAHRTGEDLPITDAEEIQYKIDSLATSSLTNFDIIDFLHTARFNEVIIDNIKEEWAVTIKADGNKFVGFGVRPDYAFMAAIKRLRSCEPTTGPITMTYNQTTFETSNGHGLSDDDTKGIDEIWPVEELEDSD